MKTISSAVEDYIKSKPFLISALSQGIINLTSLSRIIKSEIEESLRKEVKYGAIVMALKRLSSELEFRTTFKIVKIIKDIGDITVRSSLIDYNFKVSDTLLSNQAKLLAKVDNNDDFYTSSRGVNECNIVVSGNLSLLVEEVLKDEICISKQSNLSSISIKLPAENISIPGVYYFVFQRLSWEGINIYEVISTSNEFTILVNEEPWKLIKTDDFERVKTIMNIALQLSGVLSIICEPFLPNTAIKLRNILNLKSIDWNSISKENPIVLSKINKGELIFRKIEDEEIDLQLQKLNESK